MDVHGCVHVVGVHDCALINQISRGRQLIATCASDNIIKQKILREGLAKGDIPMVCDRIVRALRAPLRVGHSERNQFAASLLLLIVFQWPADCNAADLPPCLNPSLQSRQHSTGFAIAVDSSMLEEDGRCSVVDNDPDGTKAVADCLHKWVSGCVPWYRNGELTDHAKRIMAAKGWILPSEETISLADGSKYVGEVKNSKPEGSGTVYFVSGDRYSGRWHEGQPSGSGVLEYRDGRSLKCEWSGGKPNGRCTLHFLNGIEAAGDYDNGNDPFHFEVLYPNRDIYIGALNTSGLREGCGTFKPLSAREGIRGYWHEDKLVRKIKESEAETSFASCIYGKEVAAKRAADKETQKEYAEAWLEEQRRRDADRARDSDTAQMLFQAVGILAKGYVDAKAIKHGNATFDPSSGTTTCKTQADRVAEQQRLIEQQQAIKQQRDFAAQQAALQQQEQQLAMQQRNLEAQQQALARQQAQSQQQVSSSSQSRSSTAATASRQYHPSFSHEGIVRQDPSATIDGVPGTVSDYVVRVTNTGDVRQNCTVTAKATLAYANGGSCTGVSALNCANGRSDSSTMAQDVLPGETADVVVMRYYLRDGSYEVSCRPNP